MSDVLLPFGKRADNGRMVSVDDVARGLSCECLCPACGKRLVAAKGDVIRHHFRHYVEDAVCVGARETALHLFAKQIICESLTLALPDDLGPMRSAEAEVWLDGIQPDVLARYDTEEVAIEIYVTHRVPGDKLWKIHHRGLTTVEIDLSYHRETELTEGQLRDAVLRTAPRQWLYAPLHTRLAAAAELVKAQEEERKAVEEAEERARIARAAQEDAERRAAEAASQREREDILRNMASRLEEADRRARLAAVEAEQAIARRKEEAEEAFRRQWAETSRQQSLADRAPPDLQKLVAAFEFYDRVTPAAWARFDDDMARWKARITHGDTTKKPATRGVPTTVASPATAKRVQRGAS